MKESYRKKIDLGRCGAVTLHVSKGGKRLLLEFETEPRPEGGSRVSVTAYWHPQGVWGLLYWYVLVPAHGFLFRRMTRAIARRAEALEAAPTGQPDAH